MNECIHIAEGLPVLEGQRHLARAYHKLSDISKNLARDHDSTRYMDLAVSLLEEVSDRDGLDVGDGTAYNFEGLVPWMLW